MSDQEKTRQRDHWQAIAEQLGLSREGDAASEAVSPEQPEPQSRQVYAKPPAQASEPDRAASAAVFSPSPPSQPQEDFKVNLVEKKEPGPERPAQESHVSPPAEESGGDEPESPSRRRGRRRGRDEEGPRADRGKRRAEELSFSPAAPARAEPGEAPDRGRGRRRRSRSSPEEEPDLASEPEVSAAVDESEADDEIAELGDFSNWNVPPWNELIASLYRPER
ncbi:MAG TPA: hypothetical protein VG099_06330 [Gemmataceae bacterium]|jgi:hypothetical protein|nr:hypothetical protein [Gemmataceae bacterium]